MHRRRRRPARVRSAVALRRGAPARSARRFSPTRPGRGAGGPRESRVERRVRALQASRLIAPARSATEEPAALDGERAERRHELRAVDEREPLLRLEDDGREPALPERLRGRQEPPPTRPRLPRSSPARGARAARGRPTRRPSLATGWGWIPFASTRRGCRPSRSDARSSRARAIRAQQHDGANGGTRARAHAGRVGAHEVELERSELLPRDDDVGEFPEPRRNAVDDPVLGDRAVDDGARRVHAHGGARREDRGSIPEGYTEKRSSKERESPSRRMVCRTREHCAPGNGTGDLLRRSMGRSGVESPRRRHRPP